MRRLPFFTPSQRRALLVLEWVLLIGLVGVAVWKSKTPSDSSVKGENQFKTQKSKLKGNLVGEMPQEEPFETFPFDPNTADSSSLLRLGLSPWQVRAIYRYRAKHGRYHTPDDFQNVPGLTVEQWERLKPYIRIAPQFRYVEPPPRRSAPAKVQVPIQREEQKEQTFAATAPAAPRDSFPRQEKLKPGQTIDINTADTAMLKMVPGIGSKRAARIVVYRKTLGGFVSVEQAMEATEMPDSVLRYMIVSPVAVTKINVNKLSVQQLMKHPYLNFYQAKAINEYRRNHGELRSVEELSHLEAFRPTDIDRLQPYVEF